MQLEKSIVQILDQNLSLYGDKTAIKDHGLVLSYRELKQKTQEASQHVYTSIKEKDKLDVIGLAFRQRSSFIIAAIATRRIQKSYLPISFEQPIDRIAKIIRESKILLILTDDERFVKQIVDSAKLAHVIIIALSSIINTRPPASLQPDFKSTTNDIMAIMYTSGSTGVPKGVLVTEKAMIARTYCPAYINLSCSDVVISYSDVGFDASAFEIWASLLNHASVICLDHEEILDCRIVHDIIKAEGVTILWQTTSLFNLIVSRGYQYIYDNLKILLIGGERVNKKILKLYLASKQRKCIIMNGYGPTENTIFSSTKTFANLANVNDTYDEVAIGIPVDSASIKIVNEEFKEAGTEEAGQIILGGVGLAAGYLNNIALTEEKFIYLTVTNNQTERYYLTGDYGFYGSDGDIYFLGRKDTQVKIHGYRIELNEIIQALETHHEISEAVVKVFENDDRYLVAYCVTQKDLEAKSIKDYLRLIIPDFMIPTFFCFTRELPRNLNHKIAVEKLLAPAYQKIEEKKLEADWEEEASTRIEIIWKKILGHNNFTYDSNFFDVGGDSLKLIILREELEKTFDINISILDLYQYPNIISIEHYLMTQYVCN